MEHIFQAWLDHQCRILPGTVRAVMMTGPLDRGPYDRRLFWPDDSDNPEKLPRVAQMALSNKKAVVRTLKEQRSDTDGPRDLLACPLFKEEQLLGVVVIEMIHRSLVQQSVAVKQVQMGARWLEAMMALPLDPAQPSMKRAKELFVKTVFKGMKRRARQFIGPRFMSLKLGLSLVGVLLVGVFLVGAIFHDPTPSESKPTERHAVSLPRERHVIDTQIQADGLEFNRHQVLAMNNPEPLAKEKKSGNETARLPLSLANVSTEPQSSDNSMVALPSAEKSEPLTSRENSNAAANDINADSDRNSKAETTAGHSVEAFYSIQVGPLIYKKDVNMAAGILKQNGFDFQQILGRGSVRVIRLLEGLYERDLANERFAEIKEQVDSAFLIPENGQLAIYVATYHDRSQAIQEIEQLSLKNIEVTAVTTEIEMEGAILVVKHVDQRHLDKLTEQISEMGLSVEIMETTQS